MPNRPPTPSDFPTYQTPQTLTITPSPSNTPTKPDTNILLLLHGFGDTHHPFTHLARQMNLPETTCIALRAPSVLPFDVVSSEGKEEGYHWGDDLVFDPNKADGAVDVEACGYSKSVKMVREVIDTVVWECGYKRREVLVMGMGQGGGVALAVAQDFWKSAGELESGGQVSGELGGVLSLGGALPDDFKHQKSGKEAGKCTTPVLVCHGKSQSAITITQAQRIKEAFETVQIVQWPRAGDGMARNREEMMSLMQFFGRRLRSRAGVVEGAREVG